MRTEKSYVFIQIQGIIKKILLSCLLLIFWASGLWAQIDTVVEKANNLPAWVQMMNDENTNYYEAVKAFEDYFKTHTMPGEEVEEELMGGADEAKENYEREMKEENKEITTAQQRKELVEREQLSYQVKRFRNWMQEMKAFVQEDGHILSSEERVRIWQQQQEEMKQNSPGKK